MNVIIIGCGKTGARLAAELDERGFDISIVDEDERKFESLPSDFSGLVVCGEVTDIDVLKNAGCENADIAVVVTQSDNINVMVSQMLKTEFETEKIYTRILDPAREAVFRKFGLRTVCPTRHETDIFFDIVTEDFEEISSITLGGNTVQFVFEKAGKKTLGKEANEIFCRKNEMVFALIKETGELVLANNENFIVDEGDIVVFSVVWQ
ncbi:MAG: TrkA family potassium uptake protein [Clostridia bacterium]|nr:TrkA family potassium uptake protein [Clostridia bacterium]